MVSAGNTNNIFSKSNLSSVQGPPSDPVVPMLLDAAEKVGVKVIKNKDTPSFLSIGSNFFDRFLLSTLSLYFLLSGVPSH